MSDVEIYVDADACPVKEEILRVADRHGLTVHMVANNGLRLPRSPRINMVVVTDGFDAADDWIAERVGPADIAITADIPLADRCLKRGAAVIGPTGRPFTADNIGTAMGMRDLMSTLRDSGQISGHNPAFSKRDRSEFLQALENAVQAKRRDGAG